MEVETAGLTSLFDALREQLSRIVDALPELLGALLIVVVGWIIARAVRRATRGFADGLNRLLARLFPSGRFAGTRVSPRLSAVVGAIAFWSIVLVSLSLAAQVAGFSAIAGWLDRATVYLPALLVAAVILLIGYVLSLYAREQVERHTGGRRSGMGRWAQAGVLLLAFVTALSQVGIDTGVLVAVTAIVVAAVAAALALSAAFGARRYASNLVGVRTVRDQLAPGQLVRIQGITGHVLEITPSQVTLETDEGRALVPGHFLSEHVTHILSTHQTGADGDE